MTHFHRGRIAAIVSMVACAASLFAACGSSAPATQSGATTTSPPPGAADTSICRIVTTATAAYNAKNFTAWRADMVQISGLASSAQYTPVKGYADRIKQAETATTTTTSKPKAKASRKAADEGVNVGGLASALGGYLGLQHVCAQLPTTASGSSG